MAYYKLRLDVWCDWDPEDSDLEEIAPDRYAAVLSFRHSKGPF